MKELPITQENLQIVANDAAKCLGIKAPRLLVKDVRRGKAYSKTYTVSIPQWALSNGWEYCTYYVVHEVTHHHPQAFGHGTTFRQLEVQTLREFGLQIKRRRVYPKSVLSLDGTVLYHHGAGAVFNGQKR